MAQGLPDWLGISSDVQFVLGEILRNIRHVLWGPCKDVSILTEEVDELAFLFTVQVRPIHGEPLRVLRV